MTETTCRPDQLAIVMIDTANHELARRALERTMAVTGSRNVYLFSDRPLVDAGRWIPIQPIDSIGQYSEILLKSLWAFIDASHAMVIQFDGFAAHPERWDPSFTAYDYIGATWPWDKTNPVGNGGFSIRSRKLIDATRDPVIQFVAGITQGTYEDSLICQIFRGYLETKHNIRFAPAEVAEKFSHEFGPSDGQTYGFHGSWNLPYHTDDAWLTDFIRLMSDGSLSRAGGLNLFVNLAATGREALGRTLFERYRGLGPEVVRQLERYIIQCRPRSDKAAEWFIRWMTKG